MLTAAAGLGTSTWVSPQIGNMEAAALLQ